MHIMDLPFERLLPGRDVNVRTTGRDDGVDELAASIAHHGLIHPVAVAPDGDDGAWIVIDGGRRLEAIGRLRETGEWPEDRGVPCVLQAEGTIAEGRERSLAANIMRIALHPADEVEAFARMAAAGQDADAIARRFGTSPKRVARLAALGGLSPTLLDAWRRGEIDEEIARLFTLAHGHAEQDEIFARLKKRAGPTTWEVRQALGLDQAEIARNLTYVGVDAYRAAGGSVTEDLFGDMHRCGDPSLLAELAREKLKGRAEKLVAEGWSWAELRDDLPENWYYRWQRLSLSRKSATAEQKAASGCVLRVDHEGKLHVEYGVVKPAQKKARAQKGADAGDDASHAPTVSAALQFRLSVGSTQAVRAAIQATPRTGLVALLAAARSVDWSGPLKVSLSGYGSRAQPEERPSFAETFAALSAMSDEELMRVAAQVAADSLDLTCHNPGSPIFGSQAAALAGALDPETLRRELTASFDAEDFFRGAPKSMVLAEIESALGREAATAAAKLKKAALAAFCSERLMPTGWLPPQIRPGAPAAGPDAADDGGAA